MATPDTRTIGDPESAFLSSLPTIDRVVGYLGRRHGLSDADTEEFGSWARARLIDAEYAVFRQFGGRSSLPTYLSVVLANLFRDFRNSRWGRWRPSAAARRLGPLAVRLETLLYRDGNSLHDAIEVLKPTGTDESELRRLARQIPARATAREVALDPALVSSIAAEPADPEMGPDSENVIAEALATLEPEERVIVRMRFWDDFSIADIARALRLEQKPLYRRLESIQARLGEFLVARGMDRTRVVEMLNREGAD